MLDEHALTHPYCTLTLDDRAGRCDDSVSYELATRATLDVITEGQILHVGCRFSCFLGVLRL